MDWTDLAHDMDRWCAALIVVMKIRVFKMWEFTDWLKNS
jgi:hypothetical protein